MDLNLTDDERLAWQRVGKQPATIWQFETLSRALQKTLARALKTEHRSGFTHGRYCEETGEYYLCAKCSWSDDDWFAEAGKVLSSGRPKTDDRR